MSNRLGSRDGVDCEYPLDSLYSTGTDVFTSPHIKNMKGKNNDVKNV